MQATKPANSGGYYYEGETVRSRFSGQIGVLIGLVILAIVAIAFASLATWSVDDPSLSNANGREIQNAGGFWGASFADILIQFTGLASVMALVPPAIWGWLKLIQKPVGFMKKRLLAWPLAIIVSAAAFSCLPLSGTWPLPSGLGGIFGDMVLKVPGLLIGGYPSGILAVLFFLVLAIPALFLTLYASGLVNRPAKHDPDGFTVDPDTGEIFEDEGGSTAWWMGAATHFWLTAKALFKRRTRRPSAKSASIDTDISVDADEIRTKPARAGAIARLSSAWNSLTAPPDDGFEQFHREDRSEPGFIPQQDSYASNSDEFITAPDLAPSYGEEIYGTPSEFEPEFSKQPNAYSGNGFGGDKETPPPMAMPSYDASNAGGGRITAPAEKPKPGNRIVREAQPSLLASDYF